MGKSLDDYRAAFFGSSDEEYQQLKDAYDMGVTLPMLAAGGGPSKGCMVFNSVAHPLANDTVVTLTFDSEDEDSTEGFHSTSSDTSKLVIPAGLGGLYLAYGAVGYVSNAVGARLTTFAKNGAVSRGRNLLPPTGGGAVSAYIIVRPYRLVPGDYLQLQAYQNSGGALNTDPLRTEFGLFRLTS